MYRDILFFLVYKSLVTQIEKNGEYKQNANKL